MTTRKSTSKRTTSRSSRASQGSRRKQSTGGTRNAVSLLVLGLIGGVAVAVLFYSMVIRQDAQLGLQQTPRATTPSDGAPARMPQVVATAPTAEPAPQTTHTAPATEPAPQVQHAQRAPEPASSTAPSTPKTTSQAPALTSSAPAASVRSQVQQDTQPKPQAQPAQPAQEAQPAKPAQPIQAAKPAADDAIGQLIANEGDHLGALIKTMPNTSLKVTQAQSKEPATTPQTSSRTAPKPQVTAQASTAAQSPSNNNGSARTNTNPSTKATPGAGVSQSPKRLAQLNTATYLESEAFSNENAADALRARLLLMGYQSATLHKGLEKNRTVYRVRVGPFTSATELDQAQQRLDAAAIKTSKTP